ncbi:MAG: GYD domain-containing protein [Chloroflexi bacterium]|nr:GYD domain-containing protein [Chloroflexota bacterium]
MPEYLVEAAYTPEAWATFLKNPQDRTEAARRLTESLGGRLETVRLSFGEYDVVLIINLPDNASAAALSMILSAGGALKAIKTTPLLSVEEGVEAMRKGGAAGTSYRPPAG